MSNKKLDFPANTGFFVGTRMCLRLVDGSYAIPLNYHFKNGVYGYPGGTFNTRRSLNLAHASYDDCYDNGDLNSIMGQIKIKLIQVFGEVYEELAQEAKDQLLSCCQFVWQQSVVYFHAVLEAIEESGLIPLEFTLVDKQVNRDGFTYFILHSEKVFTLKKGRGIVLIKTTQDIPISGVDYSCQDNDLDPEKFLLVRPDSHIRSDKMKNRQLHSLETLMHQENQRSFVEKIKKD